MTLGKNVNAKIHSFSTKKVTPILNTMPYYKDHCKYKFHTKFLNNSWKLPHKRFVRILFVGTTVVDIIIMWFVICRQITISNVNISNLSRIVRIMQFYIVNWYIHSLCQYEVHYGQSEKCMSLSRRSILSKKCRIWMLNTQSNWELHKKGLLQAASTIFQCCNTLLGRSFDNSQLCDSGS